MAEGDKPQRDKLKPGTQILTGKGYRTVKSAKFNDAGACIEWTDTEGDTHTGAVWIAGG